MRASNGFRPSYHLLPVVPPRPAPPAKQATSQAIMGETMWPTWVSRGSLQSYKSIISSRGPTLLQQWLGSTRSLEASNYAIGRTCDFRAPCHKHLYCRNCFRTCCPRAARPESAESGTEYDKFMSSLPQVMNKLTSTWLIHWYCTLGLYLGIYHPALLSTFVSYILYQTMSRPAYGRWVYISVERHRPIYISVTSSIV